MYEYSVKLLRVIDGDTVEFDVDLGFKVHKIEMLRLAGIDTPELNSPIESVRERAKAAKALVEQRLSGVAGIRVRTEKPYPTDKYGRWLGNVVIQATSEDKWVSVNEALVNAGLAVRYDGGKKIEETA